MDPFHVVRLAGDALDQCRRRVQQGTRGYKGDPLYTARRTLHTGADLLTEKQQDRLDKLFTEDRHIEVECTWGIYQRLIAAYRDPDRPAGRTQMRSVIDSLTDAGPAPLAELRRLGRTLGKRAEDVLAYFDRPRTSNGPPKRSTVDSSTYEAPPRVPQPHQLHSPSTPGSRRIQATTTPCIVKSPLDTKRES